MEGRDDEKKQNKIRKAQSDFYLKCVEGSEKLLITPLIACTFTLSDVGTRVYGCIIVHTEVFIFMSSLLGNSGGGLFLCGNEYGRLPLMSGPQRLTDG